MPHCKPLNTNFPPVIHTLPAFQCNHGQQNLKLKEKMELSSVHVGRNSKTNVKLHMLIKDVPSLSESEVAQSCPTLFDPMDCSLPGSSVHGIFQAIVLEWIAISFSRGSSWPRDRTWVSRIVDRRFTVWATREVP